MTEGSFSDGFRMKQLPQASATGIIHSGTISGKLNGVMPATTPSGWRIDQASMPVPTWSVYSPFSRCGMPQANSTTSRPRCTSPSASDSTLPCSLGDDRGELLAVALQQFLQLEHDAGAAQRRASRPRPATRRRRRRLPCPPRRGMASATRGGHLAGGRVEHVAELAAGAGDRLAADEMPDFAHGWFLRLGSFAAGYRTGGCWSRAGRGSWQSGGRRLAIGWRAASRRMGLGHPRDLGAGATNGG